MLDPTPVETKAFLDVTEMAGTGISGEQLQRMYNRYAWAAERVTGRDVVEAACGSGQGLGMLAAAAGSLRAGDYSPEVLAVPKAHYGARIPLDVFSAEAMPYESKSADVIVLFEAIYYLPDVDAFFKECRRVLRPGGLLLIAIANKDLYDFNPSPFARRYYGVRELAEHLNAAGFACRFYGDTPITQVSFLQRVLRPVKKIAVALHLMPKSMKAKEWLKRLVFGQLMAMPAELEKKTCRYIPPVLLTSQTEPDRVHKVLLCEATLKAS